MESASPVRSPRPKGIVEFAVKNEQSFKMEDAPSSQTAHPKYTNKSYEKLTDFLNNKDNHLVFRYSESILNTFLIGHNRIAAPFCYS